MALTPGFPPQTRRRKNKFQCPSLGCAEVSSTQTGNARAAAGGRWVLRQPHIAEFLVPPSLSLGRPGQPIWLLLGRKAHDQQVVSHCWEAMQKSSQPVLNLCTARWPGKPLARPAPLPREGTPLGSACRGQWDHTES